MKSQGDSATEKQPVPLYVGDEVRLKSGDVAAVEELLQVHCSAYDMSTVNLYSVYYAGKSSTQ